MRDKVVKIRHFIVAVIESKIAKRDRLVAVVQRCGDYDTGEVRLLIEQISGLCRRRIDAESGDGVGDRDGEGSLLTFIFNVHGDNLRTFAKHVGDRVEGSELDVIKVNDHALGGKVVESDNFVSLGIFRFINRLDREPFKGDAGGACRKLSDRGFAFNGKLCQCGLPFHHAYGEGVAFSCVGDSDDFVARRIGQSGKIHRRARSVGARHPVRSKGERRVVGSVGISYVDRHAAKRNSVALDIVKRHAGGGKADAGDIVGDGEGNILRAHFAICGSLDGQNFGPLGGGKRGKIGHLGRAKVVLDVFRRDLLRGKTPVFHRCGDAVKRDGFANVVVDFQHHGEVDDHFVKDIVDRDGQRIAGKDVLVPDFEGFYAHFRSDLVVLARHDQRRRFRDQNGHVVVGQSDLPLVRFIINGKDFEPRKTDVGRPDVIRRDGNVGRIQSHARQYGNVLFNNVDLHGDGLVGILEFQSFFARALGDLGQSLFRGDFGAVKKDLHLVQRNGLYRTIGKRCGDLYNAKVHLVTFLILFGKFAEIHDKILHRVRAALTCNKRKGAQANDQNTDQYQDFFVHLCFLLFFVKSLFISTTQAPHEQS